MTDSSTVDFFSLIPRDVHHLIVSILLCSVHYRYDDGNEYVTSLENLRPLLEYAKLSPISHRVVMNAMKFKIAPWFCYNTAVNWITYFADDIQEIDLSHTFRLFFPQPLPKLSKLRKASIRTISNHLDLIRNSPSVEHLSIFFKNLSDWDILVSILASFPLKTLVMSFHRLFFKPLHSRQVTDLTKLQDACTHVEHLTLRGNIRLSKRVYDMISCFKSLKKLSLRAAIGPRDLSHLCAYSNLEFIDISGRSFDVVRNLKGRVKAISCVTEKHQIEALVAFPNLTDLKIKPSCSVEDAIEALSKVVGNIKDLSIRFPYTFSVRDGVRFPCYQKLNGCAFARFLKRAKRINFLCIDKLSFDSKAVEDILKVVGNRLKQLHLCIDWQNEPAAQRIECILKIVAKHCSDLKVLRFLEMGWEGSLGLGSSLGCGGGPTILATRALQKSCVKALTNLKDSAPHFSSYEEIRSLILARFRGFPQTDDDKPWDQFLPHQV